MFDSHLDLRDTTSLAFLSFRHVQSGLLALFFMCLVHAFGNAQGITLCAKISLYPNYTCNLIWFIVQVMHLEQKSGLQKSRRLLWGQNYILLCLGFGCGGGRRNCKAGHYFRISKRLKSFDF